jgi:predicted nucleic acid-binding protein
LSKYVIDAWAWIDYLDGVESGRRVGVAIENDEEVFTCALTMAEVVSRVARKGMNVKIAYDVLLNNSQVVNLDEELSLEAGLLHFEVRKTVKDFGIADAYVLATARKLKAKILTGDPHFKNMKEAILIK